MIRLVTQADAAASHDGVAVSLRHELELDSGYRILLLDDRGWSSSGTWSDVTAAEVTSTALACVGPDEPFGEHTYDSMAADHQAMLAANARHGGVGIDPDDLARLPHDVILSPRLLALIRA